MAKSYDLRREVQVAKFQALIDAVVALDGNTDEIEAKLQEMIVLLTSLDGKDYATETTLAGIEAQTDLLTFTGNDLNVAASISTDGLATEVTLADILLSNKHTQIILGNLLEQQKLTNKILQKIYNPI